MSKRIVLVDPWGDVLFSGLSVAAPHEEAPPPGQGHDEGFEELEEEEEACPETLRSAVFDSGFFPTIKSARDGRAA